MPSRAKYEIALASYKATSPGGVELCWGARALAERWGKNGVSERTNRSPAHVRTLQRGYGVFTAKYGKLPRLVPTQTPFLPQTLVPRPDALIPAVDPYDKQTRDAFPAEGA